MKIIISPAKKMNLEEDIFEIRDFPVFMDKTERLMQYMQSLSYEDCKKIWKCNDNLAMLNYDRFKYMDLKMRVSPALFSYEGIQYQYIGAKVLDEASLEYLQDNLRILSGFYGVVRPFDGVVQYRLEMQAKPIDFEVKNLYDYWGSDIADNICSETDVVLNLASKEYSKAVEKHLKKYPNVKFVTCVFGELKDDKIVEKGTIVKMARGEMVRYLAENNIQDLQKIKDFDKLGYKYLEEKSDEKTYVFLKEN